MQPVRILPLVACGVLISACSPKHSDNKVEEITPKALCPELRAKYYQEKTCDFNFISIETDSSSNDPVLIDSRYDGQRFTISGTDHKYGEGIYNAKCEDGKRVVISFKHEPTAEIVTFVYEPDPNRGSISISQSNQNATDPTNQNATDPILMTLTQKQNPECQTVGRQITDLIKRGSASASRFWNELVSSFPGSIDEAVEAVKATSVYRGASALAIDAKDFVTEKPLYLRPREWTTKKIEDYLRYPSHVKYCPYLSGSYISDDGKKITIRSRIDGLKWIRGNRYMVIKEQNSRWIIDGKLHLEEDGVSGPSGETSLKSQGNSHFGTCLEGNKIRMFLYNFNAENNNPIQVTYSKTDNGSLVKVTEQSGKEGIQEEFKSNKP